MEGRQTKSYKDLIVWQRSVQLVTAVYDLTRMFPKEEIYGISSQMRRAVISIPSNIAEGRSRGTRKDYLQFLRVAFASGSELETQIKLVKNLYSKNEYPCQNVDNLLDEVMRMLNKMISSMK